MQYYTVDIKKIYIVLDFISRPARSHAPVTPRIMLIGPYGSGRRTQAKALANKYEIVNGIYLFIITLITKYSILFFKNKVSMSSLIKEAIAHETIIGLSIKPHLEKGSKSIKIKISILIYF